MRSGLEWVDGDLWMRGYSIRYVSVITVNGNEFRHHYGHGKARESYELLQEAVGDSEDVRFRMDREVHWWSAPLCSWCAARPAVGEMDCDGWYWTSRCGSPQCKATGDVRIGRRNLSASNRARGFD